MAKELNLELTPAVEKALGAMLVLLHRYGNKNGVPPKALALKLWPHSTGWTNEKDLSYRQKGKGPTYAATNMLVRMKRMGLAEESPNGYRLTGAGIIGGLEATQKAEAETRAKEVEAAMLAQTKKKRASS